MNGLMPVSNEEYHLMAGKIAHFLGNEDNLELLRWNIPGSNENRFVTAILQRTQWLSERLDDLLVHRNNSQLNLDEIKIAKPLFKKDLQKLYDMLRVLEDDPETEDGWVAAFAKMDLRRRSRKRYNNNPKQTLDLFQAIELFNSEGIGQVTVKLFDVLSVTDGSAHGHRLPPNQRIRRIYYDFIPVTQKGYSYENCRRWYHTNQRVSLLNVPLKYGGMRMIAYAVFVSVRNEEGAARSPLVNLILPVWENPSAESKEGSDKDSKAGE